MYDPSDRSRMSPADRWAEQQMRDRRALETAAIIAWQVYAYETGTDADRHAMRVGWGLWPLGIGLWTVLQMILHPGDPGNWTVLNVILTGLCLLVGYALVFTKPTPRDPEIVPSERERYPYDEPFDNNWREFFGK